MTILRCLLAGIFVTGLIAPANVSAQLPPLTPLDPQATEPLLPSSVSRLTPELFGNYAWYWTAADGTQIIQYEGDFSLHLGERRLVSRDAVIWMQPRTWQGINYYRYEVFLSRQAYVRDAAGTVNSGPVLFVTFNSTATPNLKADVTANTSSAETELYQEATRVRHSVLAEPQPEAPEALRVTGTEQRPADRPRPRPIVRYRAREEKIDQQQGHVVATGNVYISQGILDSNQFLEIRADAAVLFLARRQERNDDVPPPPPPTGTAPALAPFPVEQETRDQPGEVIGSGVAAELGAQVTGAYLTGDVVLTRGERMIRASELYYDFENDRALILDAVMRTVIPDRDVPVYVRAQQVRQLSNTEYFASQAVISTSEFFTPHVSIGADRVYLTDTTPRDQAGQITGVEAGRYRMYDLTLNLEGVPVSYWPYAEGDFQQTTTNIRNIRMSYGDDFGASFQSQWYLFNLLGVETPQGVDAFLRLDYFSKRGPGAGIDVDYETENSFGLFRGYYVQDTGEDNLGPFRSGPPPTENRGRITLRHREILPDNWQLQFEASYISDPNFLEEYFNAEFEEGKQQETLLYLKKQENNWAFTTLAQWRILDWLTQTEHFPDVGFNWIGEPIGKLMTYYSESHFGWARYREDQRRIQYNDSDITFRPDTRHEIDLPIKLESINIVPYLVGRGTYWDATPMMGSEGRAFGSVGARTSTQFWRLFEDLKSDLLDVNGVRHIVKPEATGWLSAANLDSLDVYPFDYGIESIDDFYGASLALRQRWQTKRGGPGAYRLVDWIMFDVELNLFGNSPDYELPIGRFYDYRPENSIARNHVRTDFIYRISDTSTILADSNFDLNDGNMDLLNISYAVERTPRFSYVIGYRRIGDTKSNLIGGGINYVLNAKHRLALRGFYDLDRGQTESFDLTIIRKFPRWYGAFTFGLNNVEDNIALSVSVWPEGAPEAVIGSQRFTGLTESTGIRPETE